VEMGDNGNIPRVACQGACQEAALVVDEVGENDLDEILRELGDWGRAGGRRPQSTYTE